MISDIEFDSGLTDLDPVTCTVTFAYTTYKITSIGAGGAKTVENYLKRS